MNRTRCTTCSKGFCPPLWNFSVRISKVEYCGRWYDAKNKVEMAIMMALNPPAWRFFSCQDILERVVRMVVRDAMLEMRLH